MNWWISKWNPNVCVSTVCTGSVQNLWVRSDINAWNFKYNFKNVEKKTCFNWSSNPQCYYRSKTTIMICYTRPQTCFQFQMSLTSVSVMKLRNTSPKFWVWLESLEFSCKLLDLIRTSIGFWNSQNHIRFEAFWRPFSPRIEATNPSPSGRQGAQGATSHFPSRFQNRAERWIFWKVQLQLHKILKFASQVLDIFSPFGNLLGSAICGFRCEKHNCHGLPLWKNK